ncbi:MAG: SDR family NAD(P)-dependent oxidoreductase, partial [Bacteroidota bacterium]
MADKAVVITGGTSVLGAALVRKFLEAGWKVHATTRSLADKSEMMISHEKLVYHEMDLEDAVSVKRLAAKINTDENGI